MSRFINRNKIDDIIINEGISFWQIKSYMAILVKDEDKMVVAFEVMYLSILMFDWYKILIYIINRIHCQNYGLFY